MNGGRYEGPFGRLDELTDLMTRTSDALRSLHPKDRRERARLSAGDSQLREARREEIQRLHQAGYSYAVIGAYLDRIDPYRSGVPADRPVRQAIGPPQGPVRAPAARRARRRWSR